LVSASPNSTLIQSPVFPVITTQKTISLPYMAPSSIHSATFDFNRTMKETKRIDKRILKDSERTQRRCFNCTSYDCPGIFLLTTGRSRPKNCLLKNKKVKILQPITIRPNVLNEPIVNHLKTSRYYDRGSN
jgi:hypothetical protein